MAEQFKTGDRVRVGSLDREEWAGDAADALEGHAGTVETVRASGNVLVRFDAPPPPTWWKWQSPVLAWHFEPHELERIEAG